MNEPKSMGEYLSLPEAEKMRLAALPPVRSEPMFAVDWSDRITFRHGADGEIILRVPRQDEDGNKAATNHILTVAQACRLGDELAGALLENAENSRKRADEIKRGFGTANARLDRQEGAKETL